jgi:hypothetical protein
MRTHTQHFDIGNVSPQCNAYVPTMTAHWKRLHFRCSAPLFLRKRLRLFCSVFYRFSFTTRSESEGTHSSNTQQRKLHVRRTLFCRLSSEARQYHTNEQQWPKKTPLTFFHLFAFVGGRFGTMCTAEASLVAKVFAICCHALFGLWIGRRRRTF